MAISRKETCIMTKNIRLEANPGVVSLLANAKSHSDYQGTRYYFKGDLCQMSTATSVANSLGIQTSREGGIPFVMSQEDFEMVTQYLIQYQIEGWWHYVTYEEYCQIKGEYYFNGKYLCRKADILKIATELGIRISETETSLFYAYSKEDYNAIIEKLEEIVK